MAGDSIATAYVTIRPDLSGFREELRAGLNSEVDALGDKTVRIDADTADAEAKVAAFDGSLDALGDRTASPKIDVSDGDARAKMMELQARIDELSTEAATIKIGVDDTSTRRTISDLQSALESMRNETLVPALDPERMEELNNQLDGLDNRLRNIDGDLATTSGAADRAAASLGSGGAGGGGLLAMALAAAPALGALGVVGSGALAAVGTAAASAGFGVGAFALAAAPAFKQVETQAEDMLTQWQDTQAVFTEPVIQDAIGLLPAAFEAISPSVAATSVALQGVEANLAGSLGSPYWKTFSDYIAGEGGAAITNFGALISGIATELSGLAEGLAPELTTIDNDVQRWAADLDKWGQEAANGGMSGFVSYLQQNGPLLAHTLEQIGSDLATLAKDSAPLGPIWLNIIDVVAKLLGDVEQLNPTLTTWAVGIGAVALAANRLAGPIGGLSGLVRASGSAWSLASDAFSVGSTGLLAVGAASSGAGTALTAFLGSSLALVPGLDLAGAAVLQATGVFNDFDSAANAAGKSWAQNFVDGLAAGTDKVAAVRSEISSLSNQISTWGNLVQQASGVGMKDWSTAIDKLPPSLQALGQALIANGANPTQEVSAAVKGFNDSIQAVNGQVTGLQKILPGLTSAQDAQTAASDAANTAMGQAAGYTGDLALQYGQLTGRLQTANQAMTTAVNQLNALMGVELSAAQATTQFYQSVGSLTSSLKTNGTQLDGTTTAALNNQQAFESVGTSIEGVISSMEKQGSTSDQIVAKVQSLTSYLEGQAGQYGLTSAQVDAYLQQLGLTPAQVKTDLQLSNYSQASAQVAYYTGQLAALPSEKTVTITTVERTITAAGGHISGTTLANQGFASGTSSAPGGLAWVGEKGPEAMKVGSAWTIVGSRGPQIMDVPRGARILTASQTARLPRYADGVGFADLNTAFGSLASYDLSGVNQSQLLALTATSTSQLPALLESLAVAIPRGVQVLVAALDTGFSGLGSAATANVATVTSGLSNGFQSLTQALSSGFQQADTELQSVDQSIQTLGSSLSAVMTAASTLTGSGAGSAPPVTSAGDIPQPTVYNWDYNASNGVVPGAQSALDAVTAQLAGGSNPSNWSFDTSMPNGVPWTSVAADMGQSVHATNVPVLLRDSGGPLPPGVWPVANLTGHDEYVIPTPGPASPSNQNGAVLARLDQLIAEVQAAAAVVARMPTQVALLKRTGAI